MRRKNIHNTKQLRRKSRSYKKGAQSSFQHNNLDESQTVSKAKLCLMELTHQPLTEPAVENTEEGFTRWDSIEQYQTLSPNLKRHHTPTRMEQVKLTSGRIRSRTQMQRVQRPQLKSTKHESKHFWPATTVVNPHHRANQGALGREINNGMQKGRTIKQRVITPNATIREQYSFVLPRNITSSKRIRLKEYANFYRPNLAGFQRTRQIEVLLATKLDTTTEERVRQMDRLHSLHHNSVKQSKYDTLLRAHKQKKPLERILQIRHQANRTPPLELTTFMTGQARSWSKSPKGARK